MTKRINSIKTDKNSFKEPKNQFSVSYFLSQFKNWYLKNFLNKIIALFLAIFMLILTVTYSVSQWYIYSNRNKPISIGATFVPNYSRYFGIEPKEMLTAMFDDLGLKRIRLVSYWSEIEKQSGTYDFEELDWQFELAESRGVKVSLSVGLRQPRWPECHMPLWAKQLPKSEWAPKLNSFINAVVQRYKHSPNLESYQLENEFLLKVFGDCPDHDIERLKAEYKMLKQLDNTKPIVVTRSNNATPSWPINEPRADLVGAAVYKRVWDKTVTKRYFEYPLPAWYYAFLAGGTKLTTGRDTILHELQAEPWLKDGMDLKTSEISEQNKTMDARRLHHRFEYGRATGMKTIDLWGVEWWYFRKVNGDDSLWKAGKQEIQKTIVINQKM